MGTRSKRKGFEKHKPDLGVARPVDRLEVIATTEPRLEILLVEIIKHGRSQRCYDNIKRLAEIPPALRLARNLKTCIGLMAEKDIDNVLREGLTRDEWETLREIDSSGITTESRRTAHSLMDIEARIKLVTVFKGLFRNMRTRKQHMLEHRPLDD